MEPNELAAFIDQSALRPDTRNEEFDRACKDALQFRFRGLCVPSGAVALAKRRLMNSGIKVVSTCAFPHGNAAPDIKAAEAARAAAMGADEIDYVISIGAVLDGDQRFVREEATAIIRATRGKIVKAILETGHFDDEQIFETARTLADAGIHYVKTSTGFGPAGATEEHVKLLVRAVGGKALVKASGGIRERWQAVAMLTAGAAVVGTSRGPSICTPEFGPETG